MARDLARAQEAAAAASHAAAAAVKAEEDGELQAAIKLSKVLDKEGMVDACRRRVLAAPEPPAGAGVATLRLQLPSGVKLQRRFRATDDVRTVRDFLVVSSADLGGGPVLGVDAPFDLATAFPKRVFDTHTATSPDLTVTLTDAKLAPQASLFVTLVSGSTPAAL